MCCICWTEHASKKFKSGHETEQLNGETIIDVSHVSVSPLPLARPANARRSNVSRRIPNSDFMAVTGFDGQRVYVTMKTDGFIQRQVIWLLCLIILLHSSHICLVFSICDQVCNL